MGESQKSRLTGLDGLRGLAAVAVLLYHVSNGLSPSMHDRAPALLFALHEGLTLFFVLSGFLLYLGFVSRLVDGCPLPNLGGYALGRALRIWPAYVVVLTVTNVALGLSFIWPRGVGRLAPGSFVADLTLLQTYSPHTIRTGLEVAWTLSVELTFYALLPVLVWLAGRLGRARSGWARAGIPVVVMLGLGLAGFLWSRGMAAWTADGPRGWSQDWPSVVSRSLLPNAELFAFGMLAAVVHLAVQRGALAASSVRAVSVVLAAGAAVTCLVDRRSGLADALAGVAFAALVLLVVLPAASGRPGLLGRTLDTPALRGLGLVSFSVYLWHMPVVHALTRWVPDFGADGWLGYLDAGGAVLGISIGLATLSYVAVERPALGLRSRIVRRRGLRPSGAAVEPARGRPRTPNARV